MINFLLLVTVPCYIQSQWQQFDILGIWWYYAFPPHWVALFSSVGMLLAMEASFVDVMISCASLYKVWSLFMWGYFMDISCQLLDDSFIDFWSFLFLIHTNRQLEAVKVVRMSSTPATAAPCNDNSHCHTTTPLRGRHIWGLNNNSWSWKWWLCFLGMKVHAH